MLKITVVAVGTVKEQYMRDAIAEYVKRMSREYKVVFEECRECATVAEEGELLLKKIPKDSFVVALDLHGKQMSSEKFAAFISGKTLEGVSHFTFVIGGSEGIDKKVTDAAGFRLCLSEMTFTHQMT
ncbi:MAG: 23S rRNA (pseudouridine(1915)-N(3))-methyltransferase RlmH, partial [Clostridia bacterium]|nr:23S rRNA (pseudouridine(1915)-N(3))-methyltransferase RlmH [Clostridia bacterium]